MNLSERDRRALVILVAGLAVCGLVYFFTGNTGTVSVASRNVSQDNIAFAQQRLARMRQIAATLPAREAVMKQVSADLASRERGIIQTATAPQAEAALLEIARRIGKNDDIDVRGGEFGAPRLFGDYGVVYATVTFECHIEQLVNFLSDLSKAPEMVASAEERVSAANPKDKTVNVRIILAGLVPRKMAPEKKGLAGF